jgi:hypothetical protein
MAAGATGDNHILPEDVIVKVRWSAPRPRSGLACDDLMPPPPAALPKIPVMVEQLPGFVSATYVAVMAPPQTAYKITGKLSGDLAEGLAQPEIAARIR